MTTEQRAALLLNDGEETARTLRIIDFPTSFVTWLLREQESYGRFTVDASCRIDDPAAGMSTTFYLLSGVMAGNVYAERDLIKQPAYDYRAIFSTEEYKVFRTFACHERNQDNADPLETQFRSVDFHIRSCPAKLLENNRDVAEATLAMKPLTVVAHLDLAAGRRATLEFPIRHMNIQSDTGQFQAETGPIIIPALNSGSPRLIDTLDVAFTAFNRFDEAYFIAFEPVSLSPKAHPDLAIPVRAYHTCTKRTGSFRIATPAGHCPPQPQHLAGE